MSDRGDRDYKPKQPCKETKSSTSGSRPKRTTRKETNYEEKHIVITSEEETSVSDTEGVVNSREMDRLAGLDLDRLWTDTSSVGTIKTEPCWSPQTLNKKTDSIITNLSELQLQLTEARMAKQGEASMAEVMKIMLDMSTRDRQERDKREAEREEQRIVREEKRQQEQQSRDEERRAEDIRRDERRMRREQEIREEAERREAKLLLALKEAQPVVPQTVHLDNTKLPTMMKGEDIEVFIELFETAMRVGGVPEDKWTYKLHASLDTDTKLTVKNVMTNADSTYEEIKQALVGQGYLTFTAASEALMTLDDGNITKLPMRQAIQKLARFYEKATA